MNARLACLAIACAVNVSAPPTTRAEPAFPETDAGRHARAYFTAFNTGEAAMRAFWTAHGSKAALKRRPVELRLGVWRDMRAEHGALTPLRLGEVRDDFVAVIASTQHGGPMSIGFECESQPPHGLVALRVEDAGVPQGTAPPPDTGPPPSDAEIVARLAAELDSLAAAGEFAGAALLDKGGATLFGKAYGLASRPDGVPNQLDTRFNLGSINKIFTHVAITQLAEAGKLSLDDTIDRFLPDYPKAAAKQITIRMLLEHRGGVPDMLRSEKAQKNPRALRTLAGWYAIVREMPLDFKPGTQNAYSNGGFVLLGAVIAQASGEDYYDYIRSHVYEPAGMTRSDHYAVDEVVEGRAKSYTRHAEDGGTAGRIDRGKGKPEADGLLEANAVGRGSPAGGGFSTTGDLVRFAAALRSGKLIDNAKAEGMLKGQPHFGIAGGSPGVNGLLVIEGGYTLAILANLDPPAAERFARTVGAMVRRAAGSPAMERRERR